MFNLERLREKFLFQVAVITDRCIRISAMTSEEDEIEDAINCLRYSCIRARGFMDAILALGDEEMIAEFREILDPSISSAEHLMAEFEKLERKLI